VTPRPRARRIAARIPARFFRALGDANRIALVARLAACGRPCTVGELSACCPTHLSGVSRHLTILRDAGIVEAERRGKEVHYELRSDEVVRTLRSLADGIEACRKGACDAC